MTVVALRPNGQSFNGATITGATFAHEALSDNSDASYVTYLAGQTSGLDLGNLTLPAGAVIKQGRVRARVADTGGGAAESVSLDVFVSSATGGPKTGGRVEPPLAITTITIGSATTGWTLAQVDGATMTLEGIDGEVRVYEAYFDATYVAKPVTSVTAPTGTVSDTNRPTVQWSNTLDSDGGAQTHYEAKVFTQAQYTAGGFDPATSTATDASGVVASSVASRQVVAVLPDGIYRAYVRVAQTVNGAQHWSAWAFSDFTVSVALPAVPTITLTEQSLEGRVKIALADNAGAATTDAYDLERSADGGVTWLPVRSAESDTGRLTTADPIVYDYEAPNGTATQYRARALHNYSGQYAASAWATSTITWSSTQWWLKEPLRPALNVPIELVAYGDVVKAARNGIVQAIGSALPVVIADTRLGAAGASIVQTRTTAQRDTLKAAAEQTVTLLLQGPVGAGEPDRYIRVGDLTTTRLVENINIAVRRVTLPWTQVAIPAGAQIGAQYTAPPGLVLDGGSASTTTFDSTVDGGAA